MPALLRSIHPSIRQEPATHPRNFSNLNRNLSTHTSSNPTSPAPQARPSQHQPQHQYSAPSNFQPRSSRQTTCSQKTHSHSHSHCPRKSQQAHRPRSAACPGSRAGSQERVCNLGEAHKGGIPSGVLDMCRPQARAGGLMLGGRLMLRDEWLLMSFGLGRSLVLRL